MDKVQLKEILKRYTKSLKGASGATIITNYGKMRKFVDNMKEEDLGEELYFLCRSFTLHQALKAIGTEKISLKSCSTDWNAKSVANGFLLARECRKIHQERGNSKDYVKKMKALCQMASDEPSLATQLFLFRLFFTNEVMQSKDLARLKDLLNDDVEPKE